MTDIAALIERADKVLTIPAVPNPIKGGVSYLIPIDLFLEMRDALSRLTTSPLPKDIAGLIERAENHNWVPVINELVQALRALAQENERLQLAWHEAECARDRILAECDSALTKAEAERDVIRAKTIEDVIKAIKPWQSGDTPVVRAIRAIAKPSAEERNG